MVVYKFAFNLTLT